MGFVVPNSIRIPAAFEYIFPAGALFLSVDKVVDFDRIREEDNQRATRTACGCGW